MVKRAEYDEWVLEWIASEKSKGRKCFDVRKINSGYYVYYQTTRYNPDTKKREKVSAYIGKLVEGQGVVEPGDKKEDIITSARYGLGVDTGGTFTDAVIVDLDDFTVMAKRKSPTTYEDLSIGLYNSVDAVLSAVDIKPSDISLVGISTTLATNSVLEGRGGEVGLILIGWDPMSPVSFGEKNQVFVKGGYDAKGRAINSLSLDEVTEAIKKASVGVDALAISGLFANLNSTQERKVKDLAIKLTGLPTVAGHELSAELGIGLRAETAVLNGKLIPIVSKFFDDVKKTFEEKGIFAPIMVYKGDGSVMTIDKAKLYPVQTILSGPAASSMGGKILSGENDCVIVDIGGTSTDIAVVEEGYPQIQYMGAEIGGWRTRVKAVDMYTIALGGDSKISVIDSKFAFGPQRVVPLCIFSEKYPDIIAKTMHTNICDYYCLNEGFDRDSLDDRKKRIVDGMAGKGAMDLMEGMNSTDGLWDIGEDLGELVKERIIVASSITPTDIMVYQEMFQCGDYEGSRAGIHAIAEKFGMTERQAATVMMDEIHVNIAEAVLTKLIDDDMRGWYNRETAMFLRRMSSLNKKGLLKMLPKIDVPIVGIGAPAKFLMYDIGERLGTKAVFPEDFDVGNAIGAVSSKVVESLSATVTPTNDYRYKLEVPYLGPSYYSRMESAVSAGRSSLENFLADEVKKHGGTNIVTSTKIKTFMATEGGVGNWEEEGISRTVNYVEISSRAVGDPPEAH
jgi:N-methylhydantoinase A/oxoprolinase/acetone carboxylase beta subunit